MVSNNLQASFEKTRNSSFEKLEYLKNLWLDPVFAEKCALMFEEIWATTNEILNQEPNILAANDEIYNLEAKRIRLHRAEFLKKAA